MIDGPTVEERAATELLGALVRRRRLARAHRATLDPAAPPDLEPLSAEDVVAWALRRFHPRIALACSFQQEESVLLDMLVAECGDARVFTLDTGLLFPETERTASAFEARYGVSVERVGGPTLEEQAAAHGERLWERDPDGCCALRKVEPLRRKLAGLDAWVTGVRREQSPTRAGARKLEWDARHGLWKLSPLADWTLDNVRRRIAERDLPDNPLHGRGYASIGCEPCTRPGAGREGRWAGAAKTECGLHR